MIGERAGKGFGPGAGVMKSLEAQRAFGDIAGLGEVQLFEEVLENIDPGEARHLAAHKFGGEVARMDAPVAMSELLEEVFVERGTVEFDERAFGIVSGWAGRETRFDFSEEEASEATSEGDWWDASEDVASPEWIVVKFAPPSDVRFKRDFNALGPHGVFAGRKNFFIESVEHMHSKVEPVAVKLMTRSEAAVAGSLLKESHFGSELKSLMSAIETTRSAAENGESRGGHVVRMF